MDSVTAPIAETAVFQRLPAGVWRQSWHRFRRNRAGMIGLALVALMLLTATLGPALAPYDPGDQSAMLRGAAHTAPSARNWLGTDQNGYDVLSRAIYGAPTALAVGLGAMLIASIVGVLVGGVAGYVGGLPDEVLMRAADLFMVVPVFVVILAVVRLFGIMVVGTALERIPNLNLMTIILLLGLFSWPPIARMARAEFLRLRHAEFVEAARCIGTTRRDILFRHILPNALPPLIVLVALGIGGAILAEAMVSFLGFGDPKSISWGQMLFFNYQSLKVAPWACLVPGAAIFVTVLGFNLLADGLTDAVNPVSAADAVPLLAVEGLRVHFPTRDGVVRAVDGVDFQVAAGQTLGIVGESGSGKTVSSLTLLRLAPPPARIVAGRVMFEGEDMLLHSDRRMAQIRGRRMAMIFQNPATSLDPVFTIGQQLTEILRWHTKVSAKAATARALDLLDLVGIGDPAARLRQYPHELSGGMKQRVGIARALLCEPALLLADEPTTALDVTIQAQILDLLADLRARLGMAMVLVTHDMGVVARMADRITVMYAGRVCETADAATIFDAPQHPYTRALLESMPLVDHSYSGARRVLPSIAGRPPNLLHPPPGCRFHDRCPEAVVDCRRVMPREHAVAPGHTVSCLRRGSPGEAVR